MSQQGPGTRNQLNQGQNQDQADTTPPQPSSGYTSDFYIYSFKVVPCTASYAHNWSLCPFVHPKEKARRRDPRIHQYEPLPCPFDKKGANCPHGETCQYTHNVYEYWLHPKRFRTQMCQQGAGCKRTLCFFAHNLQELRFAEGQLQRGAAPPAPQEVSPGLASPAQAAALLPGLTDMRQQQQQAAAAAAVLGSRPGAPALVPYGLMAAGAGAGHLPPLQPGLVLSPMQQQWVPGYIMPQGYVMLGGGQHQQAQMMPGVPLMHAGEFEAGGGQQQQYLPTTGQWWSPGSAAASPAAMRAAAAAVCMPLGHEAVAQGHGFGSLHLDPALVNSRHYSVVPDDQVLLGQPGGLAGEGSSASYLAAQQQAQQEAVAAAVSGSQYSWSVAPVGPSTTSASASMSGLSMPTAGLSSSASVPGSSNNSLTHIRHGQGGAVSLDVLQATMQQMSVRDCHVRDL